MKKKLTSWLAISLLAAAICFVPARFAQAKVVDPHVLSIVTLFEKNSNNKTEQGEVAVRPLINSQWFKDQISAGKIEEVKNESASYYRVVGDTDIDIPDELIEQIKQYDMNAYFGGRVVHYSLSIDDTLPTYFTPAEMVPIFYSPRGAKSYAETFGDAGYIPFLQVATMPWSVQQIRGVITPFLMTYFEQRVKAVGADGEGIFDYLASLNLAKDLRREIDTSDLTALSLVSIQDFPGIWKEGIVVGAVAPDALANAMLIDEYPSKDANTALADKSLKDIYTHGKELTTDLKKEGTEADNNAKIYAYNTKVEKYNTSLTSQDGQIKENDTYADAGLYNYALNNVDLTVATYSGTYEAGISEYLEMFPALFTSLDKLPYKDLTITKIYKNADGSAEIAGAGAIPDLELSFSDSKGAITATNVTIDENGNYTAHLAAVTTGDSVEAKQKVDDKTTLTATAVVSDPVMSLTIENTNGDAAQSAQPAAILTVKASGFYPGENVSLAIADTDYDFGTAVADDEGNVSFTFALADDMAAGNYTFVARGESSANVAEAGLELIVSPATTESDQDQAPTAEPAADTSVEPKAESKAKRAVLPKTGDVVLPVSLVLALGAAFVLVAHKLRKDS